MLLQQGALVTADFSMGSIEILQAQGCRASVSMGLDHRFKDCGGPPMKSEHPTSPMVPYPVDEFKAPSSRLLDEKISDDSGTEAKVDSAFAPAGLKNPFWK
jgi:hypothetical protein